LPDFIPIYPYYSHPSSLDEGNNLASAHKLGSEPHKYD
jgi:hypothetical protein